MWLRPLPGPRIHGSGGLDNHRSPFPARPDDAHLLDGVWKDLAGVAYRYRFDHVPAAQCALDWTRTQRIRGDAAGTSTVSSASVAAAATVASASSDYTAGRAGSITERRHDGPRGGAQWLA